MLSGRIFLASLVLQPRLLILLGLAGNDLFQQIWKVIPCTRTCDLASAFRQGCQITNFTKFKINSRNLGSTLLHKYGLVVLHQHVINFQQQHFGERLKTSARKSSSFLEVFCWAKSCKETKAPTFSKIPRCKACKACWHFGISISSIHTLRPETLLSAVSISAGLERSRLTGRNPFWAGHNACEISHIEQLQNQLVFHIKQTGSSSRQNVGQNLSQLKQY